MSDKEKKEEKRERDLNWMENFKIEGRYLKLCNEFQAVVRRMKLLFTDESIKILDMSVDQKTRPSICFK